MTTQVPPVDMTAVQARTIRTLVVSQAVGAVGVTIGVATASLLARDISGSESMLALYGSGGARHARGNIASNRCSG